MCTSSAPHTAERARRSTRSINIALERHQASEKLAWQERKAEPFVFSPKLYSGSAMLSPVDADTGRLAPRPATEVTVELEAKGEPCGAYHRVKHLRRQRARSGHARLRASASLRRCRSRAPRRARTWAIIRPPATAFLMTLFNVRLGAWLPNPAQGGENRQGRSGASGPNDSLRRDPARAGRRHRRSRPRHLSLRRRPFRESRPLRDGPPPLPLHHRQRRGADPECAFSDLGGAVRKVKIDLDVDIAFDALDISSRDKDDQATAGLCAGNDRISRGALRRRRSRGCRRRASDRTGRLLYVKPSYFGQSAGRRPLLRRQVSKTFPHESTADQFYSESQFESYRRLGYFFTSKRSARLVRERPEADDAIAAQLRRESKPKHRKGQRSGARGETGGTGSMDGLVVSLDRDQ
jgi:hypothetical protein